MNRYAKIDVNEVKRKNGEDIESYTKAIIVCDQCADCINEMGFDVVFDKLPNTDLDCDACDNGWCN